MVFGGFQEDGDQGLPLTPSRVPAQITSFAPLPSFIVETTATNTPALEVSGLTKRYGALTAVNNVSFSVERGEVIGFLGPNGAGKSTTLRVLAGLLSADAGLVKVCGVPVASQAAQARRHLGFMPENNPLPEDLRVVEYLRFRAEVKGLRGARRRERVQKVMELCDLHRTASRKIIGSLSKGFRQRVGIADALLAEPDVVVLDEPTIGLDPHQILQIRELLAGLRGKHTVLLSSHILAEVEQSCDRVIIINQGNLVAAGKPAELRREFLPGERWELEVVGDPAPALALVRAADPAATVASPEAVSDGVFLLRFQSATGPELGEKLLPELARAGVTVRSLRRHSASLEDIFLAATKRGWDTLAPKGQ